VLRLEKRLFRWSLNLRGWRNAHAHRYGESTAMAQTLRLQDLARRIESCGRMMNDLRLLLDHSTSHMPKLKKPTGRDPLACDLVDLVVVGTIDFAAGQVGHQPGRYHLEKRDAYYAQMHRQRRRRQTDPFNRSA
jgi:hypothetical protein